MESRLGEKFAKILERSGDPEEGAACALTELPLRRGDVYDLEADLASSAACLQPHRQ